jgi:hypothetical protein
LKGTKAIEEYDLATIPWNSAKYAATQVATKALAMRVDDLDRELDRLLVWR